MASLMEPTLVLNKSWTAHNAVPAHKALSKVMSDRAVILDPDTYQTYDFDEWAKLTPGPEHRVIKTTGSDIRLPEIIICTKYDKWSQKKVKYSRRNLYKRDNGYCQYCGRALSTRDFTIDHVIPRSMGGESRFDNAVIACVKCNLKKANKTIEQTGMRLRRTWIDKDGVVRTKFYNRPTAPGWSPAYSTARLSNFPKSWKHFLQFKNDELYWNVELEP